jgi:dephospho-CoA kinase
VLAPDGTLDRKALARVAFADPTARKHLEAITHPRITKLMLERAAEWARRGEPLGCYEAALIVENSVAEAFRPLVVVSCPQPAQIERLVARGATRDEALARIAAQRPLAEKTALADYVIDTTGTLEQNARRTDEVLRSICVKLGIDDARYPEG